MTNFDQVEGYEKLFKVLKDAYNQSARGKGRERHANNKPFHEQPILEIGRMVGVGGHTYQICKKAQEATTMASKDKIDAAIAELYGVIIYAAAAVVLLDEKNEKQENIINPDLKRIIGVGGKEFADKISEMTGVK